ncbi:MAG: FKBP-type peptidyl-prolyl cis-trans isomerase, partial [Lentisphaeraceae bacterium]|nr:FKBP-type peptidyl-prolyl cis-trans isomerase [Lentisphaeraceae bacterium]
MFIKNDYAVSLDFIIKDDEGNVLDSSQEELMHYLHGRGMLPAKLEVALLGKSCGEQVTLALSAEDAYGEHKAEL